jgi:Tat protein secretion system quality control protein TatD with DNase activity
VEQLKLAKELNKPIFLHERSAFRRFAEIMVRALVLALGATLSLTLTNR